MHPWLDALVQCNQVVTKKRKVTFFFAALKKTLSFIGYDETQPVEVTIKAVKPRPGANTSF